MKKKESIIREYRGENIALVGCSNLFLYKNNIPESFKVWAVNNGCLYLDKIDLLFDLHTWRDCSYTRGIPDYVTFLKKQTNDYCIVKTEADDGYKNVLWYPISQIMHQYGRNLKNSMPMMILYAWYIGGVKNIYLYGISTNEFTKYPEMGWSLFQAIGFVRGKGINVFFVTDFDFDRDGQMYGYYPLSDERIKE